MNSINLTIKKIFCLCFLFAMSFQTVGGDSSGRYRVYLNPFNSHPLNDFVKQMNDEVAIEDLPEFKQLLTDIKIEPSYFKNENLNDLIILPALGKNFRDANISLVIHGLEYVELGLKEKYPKLSFSKTPIPSKYEYEFTYGEVNRISPNNNIGAKIVSEEIELTEVDVKSFIFHDGSCGFTEDFVALNKPIKTVNDTKSVLLIFGSENKLKVKIKKLQNSPFKEVEFWVADLNGDNIYDFIWGFDFNNGHNAYFNRFFSAYNLNGKWVPWRVLNAKHWDTGC